MNRLCTTFLAITGWVFGAAALISVVPAAPAETVVILTADGEGQVLPCQSCPAEQGSGGLARRATLLSQLKSKYSSRLVVDCGNSFIGAQSLDSAGRIMAAAYAALGYDAINVSYRDFRLGKAPSLTLLKDLKCPAISANLLDAKTGELLFPPYVVKKLGTERIAVVGVTQEPSSRELLPHLREQLAGIRVRPAVEALSQWLPKAKAEADKVILLYYGSASALAPIRERFREDLTAICVGGILPDLLPADAQPPLVGAWPHGRQLTEIQFPSKGLHSKAEVAYLPVTSEIEPDPEMEKLLKPYLKATLSLSGEAAPTRLPAPASVLPAALTAGRPYPLYRTAANRGVRLTLTDATLEPKYGDRTAGEGSGYLVLNTQWENTIPLTLLRQRDIPTSYVVPNLGDHIYLVINRRQLVRLVPDSENLPGHVPVSDFQLPRLGSKLRGNLVFEVPASGLETIELRYYDYAHGHFTVPLMLGASRAEETPAPQTAPQKNEFLEMAVYGRRTSRQLGAQKSPKGMTYVTIDLRARSLFTFAADVTAFDPKVEEGSQIEIGTVADWTDVRKYLALVVDGVYAYQPLPQSTLAEESRFLPDLATGGELAFLIPDKFDSLQLRCDFPNAKVPQSDEVLHPKPLTFFARPSKKGPGLFVKA